MRIRALWGSTEKNYTENRPVRVRHGFQSRPALPRRAARPARPVPSPSPPPPPPPERPSGGRGAQAAAPRLPARRTGRAARPSPRTATAGPLRRPHPRRDGGRGLRRGLAAARPRRAPSLPGPTHGRGEAQLVGHHGGGAGRPAGRRGRLAGDAGESRLRHPALLAGCGAAPRAAPAGPSRKPGAEAEQGRAGAASLRRWRAARRRAARRGEPAERGGAAAGGGGRAAPAGEGRGKPLIMLRGEGSLPAREPGARPRLRRSPPLGR